MNITLKSSAIRCGGCANNVRSVLSAYDGVTSVQVDTATKLVDVEFHEQATSATSIASQLAEAGYAVDEPRKFREFLQMIASRGIALDAAAEVST